MNKRSSLLMITFLLTIPVALVAGSYALFFGLINDRSLSKSPEEWGQFGDFFGGTLNPIFAFLAFIGVLVTVYLQSEQLKVAKEQAVIEEVQRLISGVSMEIDALFKQTPKEVPDEFEGKSHPFTVWSLISANGTAILLNDPNAETIKRKSLQYIKLEINAIVIELHQLTWALEKYKLVGGNILIVDFYRKRYEAVVCWLYVLGLIDSSQRVQEFFKPQELVPFLKPMRE